MFGQTPMSGPAMMIRALGIDPEMLMQKGAELETKFNNVVQKILAETSEMKERQKRIESMLVCLVNQNAAMQGDVVPAGEVIPYAGATDAITSDGTPLYTASE